MSWNRSRSIAAQTTLGLALVISACSPQPEEDVVATFDGGVITRPEFDSYLQAMDKRKVRTDASVPAEEAMRALLREYATTRILAADGTTPAPEVTPLLYVTPEARYLVQYYRQRTGKRTHEVTEEEALATYKERLDSHYTMPEKIRFKHIFLRNDLHSTADLSSLAEAVVEEYRGGVPFEELVATYSESASKQNDGMVGPVFRGRLDESFEDQLYALPPGNEPALIRTGLGTHIVIVVEKTEPRVLSFEEVKKQVVSSLIERSNEAERKALFDALKLRYGVVDRTDEAGLKGDDVVLTIKDRSVTADELEQYLSRTAPYGAIHQAAAARARRTMIDTLIDFNLMYLDAVDQGLDEEPNFREQWHLNEEAMIASAAMKDRVARWGESIDDETILQFYEDHEARFAQPRLLDISYLFVPFGDLAPFEMQVKLEGLRHIAIEQGFDSPALASRCTAERAICVNAGMITTRDLGRIGPKVQRAALGLEAPAVSEPIKGEHGLYVVAVHDTEDRRPLVPPEDMPSIRARYLQLEEKDIARAVREDLLQKSSFKIVAPLVTASAGEAVE